MEPLIWLALPIIITVVAAVVLVRRERRPVQRDDAERLRRLRRGLGAP